MSKIGNKVKVASIASTIKYMGYKSGRREIFLAFGSSVTVTVSKDGLVREIFPNPLDVATAVEIISDIWRQDAPQSLYFCEGEPLQRYDWIKRLAALLPHIPISLSTRSTDTSLLAKILHLITLVELKIFWHDEETALPALEQFIKLASLKEVILYIDVVKTTPAGFSRLMEKLAQTHRTMPVFLTSRTLVHAELLGWHSLVSSYMPNVFILDNRLMRWNNENINK